MICVTFEKFTVITFLIPLANRYKIPCFLISIVFLCLGMGIPCINFAFIELLMYISFGFYIVARLVMFKSCSMKFSVDVCL
ncbi:hypothetical protein XELAEV_18012451mg [Xenopus laevis]|uniref:Uncharacterized protein n=1 Tax=Xenopus laevis TaxID=8355 RepID=A0A974DPZ5_XENLA|nr:hypothetical protein XELAEV_18012451mg [Xenopus laevis]